MVHGTVGDGLCTPRGMKEGPPALGVWARLKSEVLEDDPSHSYRKHVHKNSVSKIILFKTFLRFTVLNSKNEQK